MLGETETTAPIPEALLKGPSIKTRLPSRLPEGVENLSFAVEEAAHRAKNFLFAELKPDGHWCAELESNCTITSEYVFLCQALGLPLQEKRLRLVQYLLTQQKIDGSFGIAWNLDGDVSSTAETYLALRILGLEESHPVLRKAEKYIRAQGGLEKVRIFTRISFALFGLVPWDSIPVIPPEFILLPPQAPVNIYLLSSWARGTMVPLFIISHHRPVFALPNGKSENNRWLDHLWINPSDKRLRYAPSWLTALRTSGMSWRTLFTAADSILKIYEFAKPKMLRGFALKKCENWILKRQESDGGWAGIFPPMVNSVLALHLNGYALDSDPVKRGLEAIESFAFEDKSGLRIQACVSPIWDTILSAVGILDTGHDPKDPRVEKAIDWILKRQLLVEHGDWKIYNPKGKPGGWSFEYENSWYPDVDDTAAILVGLLKQDPHSAKSAAVYSGVEWTVSMQNRDGGWAAFDINNDKHYLNHIPFSDMDSLCDPSTPDVTGRVVEALGLLFDQSPASRTKHGSALARGIEYLRAGQEPEGSWYGRWGVNYLYGTSNVLCGLSRAKIGLQDPMVSRALLWLRSRQNRDGGWGERLESYSDRSLMGKGRSTASQTAWALMGLLAYLPACDPAIERGIRWLLKKQKTSGNSGTWDENEFTGTGFPNHFYLRYHYYRHYFPLMALGRYLQARAN